MQLKVQLETAAKINNYLMHDFSIKSCTIDSLIFLNDMAIFQQQKL